MVKRLNNLVFVSGPHGAGKSRFIQNIILVLDYAVSPLIKTRTPQFYWGGDEKVLEINYFHRQALKYAQRAFENYEYYIAAKRQSNNLIIGDRCIYDSRAYRDAYLKLGLLTKEQDLKIETNLSILNLEELIHPLCIILNPGFNVCKRNLEKRWSETGWIKFMEKNMEYLKAVCDSYEYFRAKENIYYIDEEITSSLDQIVYKIIGWLASRNINQ